jgi:hypothetical protein
VLRLVADTGPVAARLAAHQQTSRIRPLLSGERSAFSVRRIEVAHAISAGDALDDGPRMRGLFLAYALQGVRLDVTVTCDGQLWTIPDAPGCISIGQALFDVRRRFFPDPVLKGLAEEIQAYSDDEPPFYDEVFDPFDSTDAFFVDAGLMSLTMWQNSVVVELGRVAFSDGNFWRIDADSAAGGAVSVSVFQAPEERETWLLIDLVGRGTLTCVGPSDPRAIELDAGEIRALDDGADAPVHLFVRRHASVDGLPRCAHGDPPDVSLAHGALRRLPLMRGVAEAVRDVVGGPQDLSTPEACGAFLYGMGTAHEASEDRLIKPRDIPEVRKIIDDGAGPARPVSVKLVLPRSVAIAVQREAQRQDRSTSWLLTIAMRVALMNNALRLGGADREDKVSMLASLPQHLVKLIKALAKETEVDEGLIVAAAFLASAEELATYPSVEE